MGFFPRGQEPGGVGSGAATPLPLSDTACGFPAALSSKVTCAFLDPSLAGEKITAISHLAFGASSPPSGQLVAVRARRNSARAGPSMLIAEVMLSGALPVLVSTTTCGALAVPIAWLPNERLGGENETVGTASV